MLFGQLLKLGIFCYYFILETLKMQFTDVQKLMPCLEKESLISKYQTEHPADVGDAMAG